ncbi:MAG: hypothetical protein BIFFINMI_00995 [Phycisphaerae bacterium]|nr:hypothetical protein [Phycisphaerae bacterium]
MQIGEGSFKYEWIDNWARIPATPSGRENGRTHGVEVAGDGRVVVFNQADPAVLIFSPDGKLLSSWGDRFAGAHGLTLVNEGGTDYLWLTDQGTGEVVKTTLDGKTVLNIRRPDHAVYASGAKYSPTWVAVHEQRRGGNGDVWVTDGYGSSHVHRYDRAGGYLGTINGGEGRAGPFKCPHAIWFDDRNGEAELFVADRGNRRVQVYDPEGRYKRVFGADALTSPCAFASHDGLLIVPELRARLTIIDPDEKVVCRLGTNEAVCDIRGWPNHEAKLIQPGRFNSPHDAVADADGNIYVVEWIIGGRISKLVRQ